MLPPNCQEVPEEAMIQLLFIILQFLRERNLMEACHEFERFHALYFDMSHLRDLISGGAWDEMEYYLRGFTTHESNDISKSLFLEISKQRFYEALQSGDNELANAILQTDISAILGPQHPSTKELSSLRYPDSFRNNQQVIDVRKWRDFLSEKLPQMVKSNPDFKGRLALPQIEGRLMALALQSLEVQYSKCQCPRDPRSLLNDHLCPQETGPSQPVTHGQAPATAATTPKTTVTESRSLALLPHPLPQDRENSNHFSEQTPVAAPASRPSGLPKASTEISPEPSPLPLDTARSKASKALHDSPLLPALGEFDAGESSVRVGGRRLQRKQTRPERNPKHQQKAVNQLRQPPQQRNEEEAGPDASLALNQKMMDQSQELAEALLQLAESAAVGPRQTTTQHHVTKSGKEGASKKKRG